MQNYFLSIRQARELAQKNCRYERNALRLFFYLKTHGHASSFYFKDIRQEILGYFHAKQAKKYFQLLIQKGWAGRDSNGKIYLRGRETLLSRYTPKRKLSGFDIHPFITQDQDLWDSFLASVQMAGCMQVLSMADGKRRKEALTSQLSEGTSDAVGVPVSLENICSILKVSRSGASRLRQRAAKLGWTKNEVRLVDVSQQFSMVKSRHDLMGLRGAIAELGGYKWRRERHFNSKRVAVKKLVLPGVTPGTLMPNPDALIWGEGRVWHQLPNLMASRLDSAGLRFRICSK